MKDQVGGSVFKGEEIEAIRVRAGQLCQHKNGCVLVSTGEQDYIDRRVGFHLIGSDERIWLTYGEMVTEYMLVIPGMGAMTGAGSDCYPYTIVRVEGNHIHACQDDSQVVSGSHQDGSAEYTYSRNENAPIEIFTLRKNGRFIKKGRSLDSSGLTIGRRSAYYDPSF